MMAAPSELRLKSRLTLVADICEELRAGLDPRPRVLAEWEALKTDPEERNFIESLIRALYGDEKVLGDPGHGSWSPSEVQ